MMSDSNDPVGPDETGGEPTDRVEGSYTEVDGEQPRERTVEGDYVRTDGVSVDESSEGDYTSTERNPDTHDPSEPHGDYVRTEPPKPHPGPHKV